MTEYKMKEFFNSQHGYLYEFCKEGEAPDIVFIDKKELDKIREIIKQAFSTPGMTGWAALRAILGVLDE